jgi:hypothetical protein
MTARATRFTEPSVFCRFSARCHTLVTRRRLPLLYDRCVIHGRLPWPAHDVLRRSMRATRKAPLEWIEDSADAGIEIPITHYEERNRPRAGI